MKMRRAMSLKIELNFFLNPYPRQKNCERKTQMRSRYYLFEKITNLIATSFFPHDEILSHEMHF